MKNETLAEGSYPFDVSALSLSEIASVDLSTLVHKRENTVVLVCSMMADGRCAARETTLYFAPKKRLALVDSKIDVSVSGGGSEYEITLTPHAFAPSVVLSLDGCDATFSEGVMDLSRNAPRRVKLYTPTEGMSADAVRRSLRILSLYSVGRANAKADELPLALLQED